MRAALSGLTTRGRALLAAGVTASALALLFGQRDVLRVGVLVITLPLLAALSVLALLAIALYFLRLPAGARLPRLALALVLGGAVGNLIDRMRLGYVVDFVHAYWRQHQWPDFNVADSAITVGVTLLVLDILRSPGEAPAEDEPGIDAAAPTAGRID